MSRPRHRQTVSDAQQYLGDWPAMDEDLLKTLPPVLRAVVRALGFGRAKDWLADHGGVNVNIPARYSRALCLEPDELNRLRVTLAPHLDAAGRVWMPKADKLLIRVRDAQIRQDKFAMSINALARQHRLSSKQIMNICREGDDRQYDLF